MSHNAITLSPWGLPERVCMESVQQLHLKSKSLQIFNNSTFISQYALVNQRIPHVMCSIQLLTDHASLWRRPLEADFTLVVPPFRVRLNILCGIQLYLKRHVDNYAEILKNLHKTDTFARP